MVFEQVQISACGLVSPYGLGFAEFGSGINSDGKPRLPASLAQPAAAFITSEQALVPDYDVKAVLGKKGIRNLDRLTRLVATAGELLHRALSEQGIVARQDLYSDEQTSILLGTSGGLQSILDFDVDTIRQPEFVQPGLFPNLVFNAAASYASIRHGIRASCITLTNGATSSLDAVAMGAFQVQRGRTSLAIAGGAEEFSAARVLSYVGELGGVSPVYGEGAALFALERKGERKAGGSGPLADVLLSQSGFLLDSRDLEGRLARYLAEGGIDADAIAHVYSHADSAKFLGKALPCAKAWDVETQLGDMSAARGAFSHAHALSNNTIGAGELVLLLELDKGGTMTLLLVRKEAA